MATISKSCSIATLNCTACRAELPSYLSALRHGAGRGAEFNAVAAHLLECPQCRRLAWSTFVAIGWRDQFMDVKMPPPDLSFFCVRSQPDDQRC